MQITSDGHGAYQWAVGANFADVDFAQLVKIYGLDKEGKEVCIGAKKVPVFGTPDIDLVSTSYVERANLTIRLKNRRFTRLTNGFSRKLDNHCNGLAMTFMAYNFCQRHVTLKTTPAVAAGVTTKQWKVADVVEMVDQYTQEQANNAFEEAFAAKYEPARSTPKTFTPTPKDQIPTPWYLNPASGANLNHHNASES